MSGEKQLFKSPRTLKVLLRVFFASLVGLVILDFFVEKHPEFPWEGYPSFYGTYGFVACVVLVLAAKYILRPLVKRREDHYG